MLIYAAALPKYLTCCLKGFSEGSRSTFSSAIAPPPQEWVPSLLSTAWFLTSRSLPPFWASKKQFWVTIAPGGWPQLLGVQREVSGT